jgi:hypothetical protein
MENKSTKISQAFTIPEKLKNSLLSMESITTETTIGELDNISLLHFLRHRNVGAATLKHLLLLCQRMDLSIKP